MCPPRSRGARQRSACAGSNLLAQLLAGLCFVLQVGQLLKQGAGFGFECRQGIAGGGIDFVVDFGQSGLNFRDAVHS